MPTVTLDRAPISRRPIDRAGRLAAGVCDCRAQAIHELGRLAELTQALGIRDIEVWRGLTRLETRLTGEPLAQHVHAPTDFQ